MGDSQGVLKVASSYRLGRHDHPLLGQANIWVEDSLRDRGSIAFVQWLVQQAIEGTAPGQVEVGVYDAALTGLSSPFDSINGGGEKLLRLLGDERELIEYLSFLREHVQGVHNVIKGQAASLTEFRRQVSYPVEGYKLVVVVCDFGLLGEEALNLLAVLLKVGPSVGVSFVVHSMTMGVNPFLVAMCDKVTVRDGAIEVEEQLTATSWTGPTAAGLIASATAVAKALSTQKMSPIAFADIQPLDANSSASSADGVSFAIGRYGLTSVEITLGDELNQRHNMLITGAVGQGKSNLISVMIHSLCVRYPPDELEMYLLDFKEGVTFQPFVTGPEDSYLPHARVLGLEADREFALSVLEHLFSIYRSRMATFKEVGVANLRQYRAAGRAMPRILLVIDEFQLMFTEGDRLADTIAGMLVKAVRLFCAAGIHVVLASQTSGGNLSLMGSAGDGLFGQAPGRIALKNSVSEAHATVIFK